MPVEEEIIPACKRHNGQSRFVPVGDRYLEVDGDQND